MVLPHQTYAWKDNFCLVRFINISTMYIWKRYSILRSWPFGRRRSFYFAWAQLETTGSRCLSLFSRERNGSSYYFGEKSRQRRGTSILGAKKMREHYDFSKMKGRKNPFVKYLKQPITMRLDRDTVSYFKGMAEESGIPYQTLINLYLRDCATHHRKLEMNWTAK